MDQKDTRENDNNEISTLYVGNLPLDTLDADIYRVFNNAGQLISAKIIRPTSDKFFMKQTCYAYVSYRKREEAEYAIKKLNHYELNGNQIRVMFCDKSIPKQNDRNVVIKNLPADFDDKTLHDTFSVFGEIISARIATHAGKNLQYGYVMYAEKKDAKTAIKYGNGLKVGDCKITIEKYEKKVQNLDEKFTNVYIKNFPASIDEKFLAGMLEKHGKINSFFMPLKENGEPKGFAFCDFADHSSALSAISELHGNNMFGMPEPFYIQRAQSKSERESDLRSTISKRAFDGKLSKKNFYITNIPSNYGEKELASVLSKYGVIVSITVAKDTLSKTDSNFGYACFSTPEEAERLFEDAVNLSLDGKRLTISYFKSKAERMYEKEREGKFFLYNNSRTPFLSKLSGGYEKKQDFASDRRFYDELYRSVYALAPAYESRWSCVNTLNRAEFSDRITNILLAKPKSEIRNMIELSNVLMENVSDAVRGYASGDKSKK